MNLEETANALGFTVEQLGKQVYDIASWIDKKGNKGYSIADIDTRMPADVMDGQYEAAYEGIFFWKDAYKRFSSGWTVRRNPPWQKVWADRYGWNTEQGQQILAQAHEQALADHGKWKEDQERIRLNRPERFELGRFDDYSDAQLMLLSEQLIILARTFSSKASQQALDEIAQGQKAEGGVWDMLEVMVQEGHSRIERELYLRHHPLPDFMYPEMPFSHFERGVSGDFKDTLTPDLWLLKGDRDE